MDPITAAEWLTHQQELHELILSGVSRGLYPRGVAAQALKLVRQHTEALTKGTIYEEATDAA